jgi:hypothetical protein
VEDKLWCSKEFIEKNDIEKNKKPVSGTMLAD